MNKTIDPEKSTVGEVLDLGLHVFVIAVASQLLNHTSCFIRVFVSAEQPLRRLEQIRRDEELDDTHERRDAEEVGPAVDGGEWESEHCAHENADDQRKLRARPERTSI